MVFINKRRPFNANHRRCRRRCRHARPLIGGIFTVRSFPQHNNNKNISCLVCLHSKQLIDGWQPTSLNKHLLNVMTLWPKSNKWQRATSILYNNEFGRESCRTVAHTLHSSLGFWCVCHYMIDISGLTIRHYKLCQSFGIITQRCGGHNFFSFFLLRRINFISVLGK